MKKITLIWIGMIFLYSAVSYTNIVKAESTSHHICKIAHIGIEDRSYLSRPNPSDRYYVLDLQCVEGNGEFKIGPVGSQIGEALFQIASFAYKSGNYLELVKDTDNYVSYVTMKNINIE